MLNKSDIEKLVNDHLEGTDKFLVEVVVSPANLVEVYVDGDRGITISECVAISRAVESAYDRDVEDYELRVSSPGLDRPFTLMRQYQKYLNRGIRVELTDGTKFCGTLLAMDEHGIRLRPHEAKKGKESAELEWSFKLIKKARPEISFK